LLQTFESFINISEEHPEPEPVQLSMTWAQLGRFLCKLPRLGCIRMGWQASMSRTAIFVAM
jgi:hypothetical protein